MPFGAVESWADWAASMSKLEALQPNSTVRGILPDCLVTVVNVQWFGSTALELTYKTPAGKLANELLYRHDEPRIEVVELGRPWSFDGEGGAFRLVSEAHRIRLARLSDISADSIEDYKQVRLDEGVEPATINHDLRVMRRITHLAAKTLDCSHSICGSGVPETAASSTSTHRHL